MQYLCPTWQYPSVNKIPRQCIWWSACGRCVLWREISAGLLMHIITYIFISSWYDLTPPHVIESPFSFFHSRICDTNQIHTQPPSNRIQQIRNGIKARPGREAERKVLSYLRSAHGEKCQAGRQSMPAAAKAYSERKDAHGENDDMYVHVGCKRAG